MKQELLTISELSDLLPEKPAKNTIYGWCAKGLIPYKKYGRTSYFVKSEIEKWNEQGRPKN
jgi:predicted DNA-binding transcriptional regulator AlpA